MKIGFDVDGVLANFIPAYQDLFVSTTGRDDFKPGDNVDPPCWDWPELRGYSGGETKSVWGVIKEDPMFWYELPPLSEATAALRLLVPALEMDHEVYYITSRPGLNPKRQTEDFLIEHLGYVDIDAYPTVLIVGKDAKGAMAKHLQLNAYIDDNYENMWHVGVDSPLTRGYLLDRAYNRKGHIPASVTRIASVGAMLDAEIKAKHL